VTSVKNILTFDQSFKIVGPHGLCLKLLPPASFGVPTMQYLAFEVKNFKGIVHLRLDFNPRQRHNVYTIVGLNESGKTTILESFNFTSYKTENLDPLNLPGYSVKDVRDLIPTSKRSNFNDKISIMASSPLEAHEQKSIKDFLSKECGSYVST
jgi:predicted ATP-binding protein involved in virulence